MPDKNLWAVIWLAKTNKRILTRPAVPSGEERGLLSRTAAGDRAYPHINFEKMNKPMKILGVYFTYDWRKDRNEISMK